MNTTSRMSATGDVLKVPFTLASECTIGGLNAPSMRLAVVLATMAFHGHQGEWSINKPDLELRAGVVLDSAERLLAPVRGAILEKDDISVPVFERLEYEPGQRFKTAGVITARLSFMAREMLFSQQKVVRMPLDEFRAYSSISAVILRLRLAARLQDLKTSKNDVWRLKPEDLASTGVFGSYSKLAMITRTNAKGETAEYVSLSRAEAKLLRKGVDEINARSQGAKVDLVPIKTSAGPKSHGIAIDIITTRIFAGNAKKPMMSDLNKRSKQPALAAR